MKMQGTPRNLLLDLDMPFLRGGGIKGEVNILWQAGGPQKGQKTVHAILNASRVPLDMMKPFIPPGLTAAGPWMEELT